MTKKMTTEIKFADVTYLRNANSPAVVCPEVTFCHLTEYLSSLNLTLNLKLNLNVI